MKHRLRFPQPMWNVAWVSQNTVSTYQQVSDQTAGKAFIFFGHIKENNKNSKIPGMQLFKQIVSKLGWLVWLLMQLWGYGWYSANTTRLHWCNYIPWTFVLVVSWYSTNDSSTLVTGKKQWMRLLRQESKSEIFREQPEFKNRTKNQTEWLGDWGVRSTSKVDNFLRGLRFHSRISWIFSRKYLKRRTSPNKWSD